MSDGGRAIGADGYGALLGRAYEVDLEPEGWRPFADDLRSVFDSDLALVQYYDHVEPERSFVVASGLGHEFVDAFQRHWGGYEGRADDSIWQVVRDAPAGSITLNVELQSLEEARRTEIHQVLAAPWGLDYFLTGVFLNTPSASAFLSLGRRGHSDCFDATDKDALAGGLLGHLNRNVSLRGQFARTRSRASVLGAVLDALPSGVLVFDRAGRPIVVNRRAEELLGPATGVALRSRRLIAASPRNQQALDLALATAIAADGTRAVPRPVTVRGSASGAGVRISFTALRGRLREGPVTEALPPGAACVAMLEPLPPASPPARSALAERFGFTPAEERLCQLLLAGRTLQDAADELDISRNTAKTHLTRIFDKTGARSQVGLIGLLRA